MKKTPDSYNMRRNEHKQAAMFWQGYVIKVDAGMELLLTVFNKIPGIATVASCIGDREKLGYVSFVGDNRRTVRSWVRKFAGCGGVFREAAYRNDIHSGCVRFERARLDDVCRLVSDLAEGV